MKIIYTILCLALTAMASSAQKLPDVQIGGLAAPANIKIDGKAIEWNDTFAADNKRTNLLYSLANDDKNLYLVIKAIDATKIFLGGITFTVNIQGKKREKDGMSITYPLIVRASRAQGGRGGQNRQSGASGGFPNRSQQTDQQKDSIALVQHKIQLAAVKEIKVGGFPSITDSLISIYNEYGLKAAASFDAKGQYIYETAIPLSLLGLNLADAKEFAYQIKVNGRPITFANGNGAQRGNARGNLNNGNQGGGNVQANQDLNNPTDFWGKYVLLKNK